MLLSFVTAAQPTLAEAQQNAQTNQLVQTVTTAFFAQLVKNDFAAERAFMADSLAAQVTVSKWSAVRAAVIQDAGGTPNYTPHRLTYYNQGTLLAAVDFSGRGSKPDTYVCGFILWEIPEPNKIGFSRFEQNVVPVAVFRKMPVQQAAKLMADWYCPAAVIQTVLQLSKS